MSTNKDSPVFNIIGVSRLRMTNDGDGVTTLVAGHGCPLRCRYCLNPQCFERPDPIRSYTVPELLEEVRIDDLYFQATGGGIVFGGGEPLLYPDFIHEFKAACPPEWKIGLESSLNVPLSSLKKVISDIDFYIIDIKDMNPEIYRAYSGIGNEQVIRNLEYLITVAGPDKVCIRIPLISSFNTEEDRLRSEEQLREMGFTTFDKFRYNVERSESKRGKDACSQEKAPTE